MRREPYRYRNFCSDISGQDIRAHNDEPRDVIRAVRDWLSSRLSVERKSPARLARVAEVWDKLNRAAQEVDVFNLDRKPMVFAVFGLLAEAAR